MISIVSVCSVFFSLVVLSDVSDAVTESAVKEPEELPEAEAEV